MSTKKARPERTQTDESLAVERARSDQAVTDDKAAVEEKADIVLEQARDDADEVLSAARAKADDRLARPSSPAVAQGVVEQERLQEDEVLRGERAAADEALRRERAASLARLFPLERDKTDLYLLTERARSDDALANRDDFLGMVSHDLRDLLNVVSMSGAMIAEDTLAVLCLAEGRSAPVDSTTRLRWTPHG